MALKRIKTGKNQGKNQVRGVSNLQKEFNQSWKTDYIEPALKDMVKRKSNKRNA